ncbi:hypothetical protein F2P56_020555 [Juglans regia]|uniref:Salutaridine reductase-like n=1 Tax=Juglans regia TaxID=51240 RepID=A0A833XAI0_JUGRE|nr:hypothetical protein F2P56_020555 [Juglans regia]
MNPAGILNRIAVVTGANKGIGFEISKQLASNGIKVILTARDAKRGNEAVEELKAAGYSDVLFHQLDVTDPASVSSLASFISTQFGKLDILFVSNENARKELGDVDQLTEEKVDKVVEGFVEDVKENLIDVKGWPTNYYAYIVSKAALNAYARVLAKNYPNFAINSVHPGYVKTDINHNSGVTTAEEGAKGPVMLALMPHGGPSNLFYMQTEVSTF